LFYTEALHSGDTIDDIALVSAYRKSYDRLRAVALSPEASLAMIKRWQRNTEMASTRIDLSDALWMKSSYSNASGSSPAEEHRRGSRNL
jgi:DNA/RNA-binding domain of Phe-tRNA-synthetase-like protein